jgi:hypothetical protein
MKSLRICIAIWIGVAFCAMSTAAQTFNSPVGANNGNYPLNTNSLWVGDGQYGLNSYDGVVRMLNTINGGGIAFRLNLNGTFTDAMYLNGSGNVGIGTTNPISMLHVYGRFTGGGVPQLTLAAPDTADGSNGVLNFRSGAQDIARVSSWYSNSAGNGYGQLLFSTRNGEAGGPQVRLTITEPGYVGIGTTSPGKPLDVAGTIRTSANGSDTGGVVYPDGSQQTTAWTGTICGGDYAESMDVAGQRKTYEPGDVLVLDSHIPGKVLKSVEAYATTVAGIYSTRPGTVGRRQLTPKSDSEVPMALVGVVPTKVSAENGPIAIGDLLVSSATPGYAMKGTDRSRMLGAVIGKAMGSLGTGTGMIEVLVMLQ